MLPGQPLYILPLSKRCSERDAAATGRPLCITMARSAFSFPRLLHLLALVPLSWGVTLPTIKEYNPTVFNQLFLFEDTAGTHPAVDR
jgi:hypothetical protein